MSINLQKVIIAVCAAATVSAGFAARAEGAKLHRFSTTIEKERPQLNEETKRLIASYRRNPSEANRSALRKQVGINYDKVLDRKKAKLEELKRPGMRPRYRKCRRSWMKWFKTGKRASTKACGVSVIRDSDQVPAMQMAGICRCSELPGMYQLHILRLPMRIMPNS